MSLLVQAQIAPIVTAEAYPGGRGQISSYSVETSSILSSHAGYSGGCFGSMDLGCGEAMGEI